MGLIDAWSRAAASRAHVLIVGTPGAFRQRVALERAVAAAGWCAAESVADADVLAVVGKPGAALREIIDHTWDQMSEPRARVEVEDEADVSTALAEARAVLGETGAQRSQAIQRPDSQRHDHGDMDHGDMAPDGIPLAEGAEDRDGLEMDELHLPLGPVLAHWPAGVVLRLTLHGDVVADAEVEWLDGLSGTPEQHTGPTQAARLLDAAASVLSLAGQPAQAARAARQRDRCLDGAPVDRAAIDCLATRVRRSRVLRWVLNGLVLVGEDGRREELHDRLVDLLERAQAVLGGDTSTAHGGAPTLAVVPELVRGHELAAVRLWMAALSADLTNDLHGEAAHG